MALGYLDQPELTVRRFVAEPASGQLVYRTGDLARLLANGAVELLGGYMIPARWVVLSEIPLGPTGKVDRRQLLARLPEESARQFS